MFINKFNKIKYITRNKFKLQLYIYKISRNKLFSFKNATRIPVNSQGIKTLRFRKKKKLNTFWNYLIKPIPFFSPTLITQICFSYKLYKFISIMKNSSGIVTSKITTENNKLFSYFYFIKKTTKLKKFRYHNIKNIIFNSYLFFTPRRSFISFVELFLHKGAQYAKATGSNARILDYLFLDKLCNVQLPSSEVKLFSIFATCINSTSILKTSKKLKFDNKRYKRLAGFGPNVRGVAMNAIDHPHGGKTKSIKFPKTPWGLATKKK